MTVSHTTMNDAKRDFDKLIDRTVDGERIIIVADGTPQAVVVNLADYARIARTDPVSNRSQRDSWLGSSREASQRKMAQREQTLLDVEAAVAAARKAMGRAGHSINE